MQAARRSGPIGSYLGHALADPEPRSAETAAPRPGAAYPAPVVTLSQLSLAHPPTLGAGAAYPAPVVALVQRGVAHLPAHQAGCWLPRTP